MVVTTADQDALRVDTLTDKAVQRGLDGRQVCLADSQHGECVHKQDVHRASIVDQDTSDDVVCYSYLLEQLVVVWVEELIGLIISEGNQDTALVANLHDMFDHVDVFSTCYLPSLVDIASPVTRSVTRGYSSKNGVDNVLGLPDVGPVTCSWGRVRSGLAGPIDRTYRGDDLFHNSLRCLS
ncbi:hypothetical protein TIFTF001_045852 [Ficus carica]|uniref:Uncharacterized protein n=1 Tax=Ficus carica TaxID=3494 RepID=A0AA87Z4V0_FICCA|nr:hypothetical protein TIFTF001_045852 [Ficus carica]